MEYYGEKPKKFTKEWWPYFWDYYKWHTIVVVAVIFAIVITVAQVRSQEKYDASLVTAGKILYTDEAKTKLKSNLDKIINDVDDNGTKSVIIEQLAFSLDDEDAQYAGAMQTKFDLKMQTDETFAFVVDKEQLERSFSMTELEGCFAKVDEWLTESIDETDIYKCDGVGYAVNLKNSKLLKDLGINGENAYAFLRYNYKTDKPELEKQYENAKMILNELVKSGKK